MAISKSRVFFSGSRIPYTSYTQGISIDVEKTRPFFTGIHPDPARPRQVCVEVFRKFLSRTKIPPAVMALEATVYVVVDGQSIDMYMANIWCMFCIDSTSLPVYIYINA